MANKKTPESPKAVEAELTEADILTKLEPLAKALKIAVGKLWDIFVRRYIAKGVSEIFIALVISAVSLVLLREHPMVLWVPFVVVAALLYDAIQLLINPAYYAIEDIMDKIYEQKPKSGY